MAKKEKRNFVMIDKKGDQHIFTGRTPRQAALKAATRGFKNIRLRERGRRNKDGSYSIHVYKGDYKMVSSPSDAPDWLPNKVKKPKVSKKGVERVDKIPK
ncbi:MAG: non-histone chromosomal MC1 family protein [Candidatus Aenigmatarchaeota archaeon]